MYDNVSVLIFGASGRQALPVMKGFHELGCKVTAYTKSKLGEGYLTRYCDERILFDDRNGTADYFEFGAELIRQNEYDLVLPLGDSTARYLSKNKQELEQYSRIAVNNWETFQFAIDKARTMEICERFGVSAPRTVSGDDIEARIEEHGLKYPLVVKPRTSVGSIGFNIIKNADKMHAYLTNYDGRYGPLLVQEYVRQGEAPQYRADFFRDRNGEYKAALAGVVTRWYPLDGGSGIFAMTIHNDDIISQGKKLLDAIGWIGYANIDLVWDEQENLAKIIEINGRTGATIILDYVAGVNISQLILENELGFPVTDMTEYADGKKISCLLPDLLWFLKSGSRFNTNPSWFDRKGVKDAIFSWDDPKPAIGFFIRSVTSFSKKSKKRAREVN